MSSLQDRLHKLADSAPGRCHSCSHQHSYDLPSGTRYWCRAFDREMSALERNGVSGCDRWQPLRVSGPGGIAETNPLLQPHLQNDDHLFWRLKCYLDLDQLDLRTLMVLANGPSLRSEDLDWIDDLDERFGPEDPGSLNAIISELQRLGYREIAGITEKMLRPEGGSRA